MITFLILILQLFTIAWLMFNNSRGIYYEKLRDQLAEAEKSLVEVFLDNYKHPKMSDTYNELKIELHLEISKALSTFFVWQRAHIPLDTLEILDKAIGQAEKALSSDDMNQFESAIRCLKGIKQ